MGHATNGQQQPQPQANKREDPSSIVSLHEVDVPALSESRMSFRSEVSDTPTMKPNPGPDPDTIREEAKDDSKTSSSIPFADCVSLFAIDVSGSTQGPILTAEKLAVKAIAEPLRFTTKSRCLVAPWESDVKPLCSVADLQALKSRGGTRPSALLTDPISRDTLVGANLWFLMTDGFIHEVEVKRFARVIDANGLQSRACAIVLFGNNGRSPMQCNISVGVAVFSMTPDAVFLFHDVKADKLYVLQAKGCFTALVADWDSLEIMLDEQTTWADLPQTTYGAFMRVRVPPPPKVDKNKIVLQDRTQVDLEDLAGNRLGGAATRSLFSNSQSLNSAIMSMSSRGQAENARKWVNNQRLQVDATFKCKAEREDKGGVAAAALGKVILALNGHAPAVLLNSVQEDLRKAHADNWVLLARKVRLKEETVRQRNAMVDDADSRLRLSSRLGHSSSRLLSTSITSRFPHAPTPARLQLPNRARISTAPSISSDWDDCATLWEDSELGITGPAEQVARFDEARAQTLKSEVTFTPGYTLAQSATVAGVGHCPLCGDPAGRLALLLKQILRDAESEGYPKVGQEHVFEFPLAIKTSKAARPFASFTCCETCAYHMVRTAQSPTNEQIVAALPVAPSLAASPNKRPWIDDVFQAFEGRFSSKSLTLMMLGLVSGEIVRRKEAATKNEEGLLDVVLAAARQQIQESCQLAHVEVGFGNQPFFMPTQGYLDFDHKMFQYPMESFVIILRSVLDIPVTPVYLVNASFMRVVLHIVEHTIENKNTGTSLRDQIAACLGVDASSAVWGEGWGRIPFQSHLRYPSTIGLMELEKAGLVGDSTMAYLRCLCPSVWDDIDRNCRGALWKCLEKLALENPGFTDGSAMLRRWRSTEGFFDVFVAPSNEAEALLG